MCLRPTISPILKIPYASTAYKSQRLYSPDSYSLRQNETCGACCANWRTVFGRFQEEDAQGVVLIAARRRACDSEENSSQHVSRREGGRRGMVGGGGFVLPRFCKEREIWRGADGAEKQRERNERGGSADQSLFFLSFVGEAKSETYRCRKPGPTRAGQASRRRRPAWRPRERRQAVYATRYQDVREIRE